LAELLAQSPQQVRVSSIEGRENWSNPIIKAAVSAFRRWCLSFEE